MTSDAQGAELLQRFLDGTGESLITNGGPWGEYLNANSLLTAQINSRLLDDAFRNRISGAVDITFHAEIENGYRTGYEMLHGTNADLGDFQISGSRTVFDNSGVRYDVQLTWNDRIDPNFGYIGDLARTVIVETMYDPVPYNVQFNWTITRFFGGN